MRGLRATDLGGSPLWRHHQPRMPLSRVAQVQAPIVTSNVTQLMLTTVITMAASDTMSVVVWQNTGSVVTFPVSAQQGVSLFEL